MAPAILGDRWHTRTSPSPIRQAARSPAPDVRRGPAGTQAGFLQPRVAGDAYRPIPPFWTNFSSSRAWTSPPSARSTLTHDRQTKTSRTCIIYMKVDSPIDWTVGGSWTPSSLWTWLLLSQSRSDCYFHLVLRRPRPATSIPRSNSMTSSSAYLHPAVAPVLNRHLGVADGSFAVSAEWSAVAWQRSRP